MRQLEDVIDSYYALDPSVPRQHHKRWVAAFDDGAVRGMSPLTQFRLDWRRECEPQEVIENVLSLSVVACRPKDEQERARAAVVELLTRVPDDLKAGATALSLPYYTDVAVASAHK